MRPGGGSMRRCGRGWRAGWVALAIGWAVLAPAAAPLRAQDAAQNAAPAAESGKFRLHKFEQAIGEESYAIKRKGESLEVKADFLFTDRGNPVPLTATLRTRPDLTPESFVIKGQTSRLSTIDAEVQLTSDKARIRDGKDWKDAPRPERFFTISGYSPVVMQMLLVRYWASHGSPASLKTLPEGEVQIERRGGDTVKVGDKQVALQHYSISGLIWGREALWFDGQMQLVAMVGVDAEFDHFEAIREGYEPALGFFVAKAGEDGMASLAELSKRLLAQSKGALALVGGTLIDGTGRDPVPDSAVVVKDGRIVAAGPRASVRIPKGARVIDTTGKYVLPGLWDMHAHFEQVEWGPIYLAAGVTTVRDCGNEFEFITAVRDALRSGRGLGPRLLLAGIVDGTSPFALGVARVDTPEQAKGWVDRYHAAGFEQMKIYSSVKREEVAAIAKEAHRLGMTVTGHIPEGMNAYDGIEAGMDQINHIQYIPPIMVPADQPRPGNRVERLGAMAKIDVNSPEAKKAIQFLKGHGTVIDPTMALMEMIYTTGADHPVSSYEPGIEKVAPQIAGPLTTFGLPPAMAATGRALFAKYLEILGALHRAGIPIVAGTDQSVPGYSLHREIELYVHAGFTPMEAIQAATSVPARVMKVEKEVGTVEAGKRADLIVVNGNPLEKIANLRNVEKVVTAGAVYDPAPLWQSVDFKP
jgi:imidazolonepropionase-like amidohydrolase